MTPEEAVNIASSKLKLIKKEENGVTMWWVLDENDSGSGYPGTKQDGEKHYNKEVMFVALDILDSDHDWHEYDWHTLDGSALQRVQMMMQWRAEFESARSHTDFFSAVANSLIYKR